MSMRDQGKEIHVATVGRPHGVRGDVRLFAHTLEAASLESLGMLHDARGRRWRVRWRGLGIAQLSYGVEETALSDRDAAAKLVGEKLFVYRAQLPSNDDDEYYHADLVGLKAFLPDETYLGTVRIVHDYGAGTSLEIVAESREWLIPFTRDLAPHVDLTRGRLTVILPSEIEVKGDLKRDDDEADLR